MKSFLTTASVGWIKRQDIVVSSSYNNDSLHKQDMWTTPWKSEN